MPTRAPFLPAGLALSAILALSACGKPAPAPEPVRAVKVMTVGARPLEGRAEFPAEVRARTESRLGFRVGGKLAQRQAEVGQAVRAGQVLAQLDPQDLKLAQDAARSQVAAAQTQRDLAAADFKRFAALREQNFISGAELERRDSALKAAQAQLEQAQAQLAVQGNQAGYASLVAPAAGVVTAVDAEPGQVLSSGAPVVRLALDGPRDAVFTVPEDRVATVRPGQAVQVRRWSDDRRFEARVREVAASADPLTRTFQVKVALPADAGLPLGSTVNVRLGDAAPAGASAIRLPTSALRQQGQGSAVWLLDPQAMTVRLQPVSIAGIDGNEAVVAAGLAPGAQVVTAGVHVLSPGQKVTVYAAREPQ